MDMSDDTKSMEISKQEQVPTSQLKDTSFTKACFLGINALTGVGMLSIPFALSGGGWLSLIFLFLVASICCYTGILLQRCMDLDPKIATYPDIGNLAFGRKGKVLISTFVYILLYLLAVEFLILEGDNLHKLFPHVYIHIGRHMIEGKRVFIIIAATLILPTVYVRSFRLLAYVSLSGVLASIVLLFCVFCGGVGIGGGGGGGVGFHEKGMLWRWTGLPTAVSMYCFCFSAHGTFPTICNSMANRAQFQKVLVVCFVPCTMAYGSMAIMGYLMFGQNLTSQITLNLPTKDLSTQIAIYTTLINPFAKYALVISPIMIAIEDASPFKGKGRFICLVMRTLLVISTVMIAWIIPFFGHVMAFTGASFSISLSMLFPCICYMKIHQVYKRLGMEFIVLIFIIITGTCVSLIGTYISIKDIIKNVGTK